MPVGPLRAATVTISLTVSGTSLSPPPQPASIAKAISITRANTTIFLNFPFDFFISVYLSLAFLLLGIYCFCADPCQSTQLSGKGADRIHRSVHSHADDGNLLFRIRDPHSSDNMLSVLVKQSIYRLNSFHLFYDNTNNSHSGLFHLFVLQQKTVPAKNTDTCPQMLILITIVSLAFPLRKPSGVSTVKTNISLHLFYPSLEAFSTFFSLLSSVFSEFFICGIM